MLFRSICCDVFFFFFNDTATTEIYTLSLHDALPIYHLLPDSNCIDTGDPNSPWENEPLPNGARINMGAYGNTNEATRSRADLQFVGFNVISKTRIARTT